MAVLTAAVMAGCGNTADEQLIEDISGDTSITAEAEAPENEETSETEETTETEAEETTAETESVSEPETTAETTVPETEHTTEAETTTEETEASPEEKDGMRIAELKDIDGKVWLDDEDDYYIWGKDQSIYACDAEFLIVYSTFENGKLAISFDGYDYYDPYTMYIKDDKLYIYYYDDPDDYVIMEKYHQPDFSLSDLDGKWIVSGSDISSDFLWGVLYIKNGKGTYIDDMDSDEHNAELILDNDKITLILGENKWEYTIYFISCFGTNDEILYLINNKDPVALERY